MRIAEYNKEKKKESSLSWYLLAVIFGVALFFFFLIFTKASIFIIKLAIAHWIYASIGVLIFLILIKKIRKGKENKEIKRDEHQYR